VPERNLSEVECARLITEIESGAAVDPSRITLSDFLDRFERDWVALHTTPASAHRYKLSLDYARQHLGGRRLQDIEPADLAKLYGTLSRTLAARTVRHCHTVLHNALEHAKVWKLLRDNPADLVKPPPIPETETQIPQPDQIRDLLDRLQGHPLRMLAQLAVSTGARRNELLALRWSDLDLAAGTMRIVQAFEQANGVVRIKAPKTRAGKRVITLPPAMATELRRHWAEQQEQRLSLGLGRSPADGFVLCDVAGCHLTPDTVSGQWARAMDAIGMPDTTLHSLRHFHASSLIAAGMDILTISRRLGHASPSITLGVYGHMITGTDAQAAAIMDRTLNGSKAVAKTVKEP
jgi:integrase